MGAASHPGFPPTLLELLPRLARNAWFVPSLVGGATTIGLTACWLALASADGDPPAASNVFGVLSHWVALGRRTVVGPLALLHPLAAVSHGLVAALLAGWLENALTLRGARRGMSIQPNGKEDNGWFAVARKRCQTALGDVWLPGLYPEKYGACRTQWLAEVQGRYRYAYIVAAAALLPVSGSTLLCMTPESVRGTSAVALALPSLVGVFEALVLSLLFFMQETNWERLFSRWQEEAVALDKVEDDAKRRIAELNKQPLGVSAPAEGNLTPQPSNGAVAPNDAEISPGVSGSNESSAPVVEPRLNSGASSWDTVQRSHDDDF